MSHTLIDAAAREEAERRARRAAEEQRDRDRRHRDDVHELGEEEDREPDARVLGVEPADELLLGLDEVEGRVVRLGGRRDEEDHERHQRRQPVPVARRTSPTSTHAWSATIVARRERARLDQHAEDAEPERGFVREQLRGRAHRAEQRVLRSRRPAREHHAVHADARHREDEQHAHRQLGDLQIRVVPEDRDRAADRDHAEHQERGQDRQVGREPEHGAVGGVGDRLLLEEQLDAVGERLQHAVGPGVVGADAVLHVGDDLAHAPDVEHHRDEQQHERGHDLDQRRRRAPTTPTSPVEERDRPRAAASAHRSVSTRTSVTGGVDVDSSAAPGAPGGEREPGDAGRHARVDAHAISVEAPRAEVTLHLGARRRRRCGRGRAGSRRSGTAAHETARSTATTLTARPPS